MIIEKGFFNRMKKLQIIRMLGSGMDIGELNEYAYEISFLLIQNIFLKELSEDSNRTRNDMIFITEKILATMKLNYTQEIVERIVDGTLWYRDPTKQEGFKSRIYDESKGSKQDYIFRYFKVDREHSRWEQGGSTVYMLTEESQEMVFITREILEEFGFDLEQFYTLQLIKTGNFSKAKNSIDNLIARVKTLINREKEYKTAYTKTFREALSSLKGKINFKNVDAIEKIEVVETPKEVDVVSKNEIISNSVASNTLFAIPMVNGYKLVNDKPETIFILKKTSADNIFIAQKDSKSGVLMKKSSGWFFEYYEGDKLFSEKVEVKF